MKYLVRFNESKNEDIKNDVSDILIDLSDDGISYDVKLIPFAFSAFATKEFIEKTKADPSWREKWASLIIKINFPDKENIKPKKYVENIERLFDYLESHGFVLLLEHSSYSSYPVKYRFFRKNREEIIEALNSGDKCRQIELRFRN